MYKGQKQAVLDYIKEHGEINRADAIIEKHILPGVCVRWERRVQERGERSDAGGTERSGRADCVAHGPGIE